MLSSNTNRYDWPIDCGPADILRRVEISVVLVPTRDTTEYRLAGPVLFGDVAATRTHATGVLRINKNQRNTNSLCLVRDKSPKLIESPAMQNSTLLSPSPNPAADALEVFNGNS